MNYKQLPQLRIFRTMDNLFKQYKICCYKYTTFIDNVSSSMNYKLSRFQFPIY